MLNFSVFRGTLTFHLDYIGLIMSCVIKLSDEQIIIRLQDIKSKWSYSQGKLVAEFKFRDFSETFAFMTRVALAAEAISHHPDWHNQYNRLKIQLFTHECNGITDKDFELARRISLLAH